GAGRRLRPPAGSDTTPAALACDSSCARLGREPRVEGDELQPGVAVTPICERVDRGSRVWPDIVKQHDLAPGGRTRSCPRNELARTGHLVVTGIGRPQHDPLLRAPQ